MERQSDLLWGTGEGSLQLVVPPALQPGQDGPGRQVLATGTLHCTGLPFIGLNSGERRPALQGRTETPGEAHQTEIACPCSGHL